eukprot:COSAG04_NODE_932_length_9350_cov_665.689007_9_plen_182_part_00
MNSGRPELLGPGWHGVLEPLRSWHGAVPLTQEVIQFSTVEVVTVKDGFAGLAWDRGEPVLLPPTSSAETLATCNQELTTIGIKINKIAIVKLDITDVEVLRALAKGATIVSTRTLSAAAADTTLEIIFSALACTSQAGRALGSLEALSSVSPQPTQLRAALIGGGRVLTAGGCDSREAQGR